MGSADDPKQGLNAVKAQEPTVDAEVARQSARRRAFIDALEAMDDEALDRMLERASEVIPLTSEPTEAPVGHEPPEAPCLAREPPHRPQG